MKRHAVNIFTIAIILTVLIAASAFVWKVGMANRPAKALSQGR